MVTNKGVFEHMGVLGHEGSIQMPGGIQTCGGVQMPKTYWGVNSMPPSDFEQFLLWEGVVLKELILNGFYFGRVWCSLKNIWEMHREALGTYKGCLNIWGVWTSGGI